MVEENESDINENDVDLSQYWGTASAEQVSIGGDTAIDRAIARTKSQTASANRADTARAQRRMAGKNPRRISALHIAWEQVQQEQADVKEEIDEVDAKEIRQVEHN